MTEQADVGAQATPEAPSGEPSTLLTAPVDAQPPVTEGEKADPPVGAPEKYELTMPDGVQFDQKTFETFEPVLKSLNLSNEAANQLAGKFAEMRAAEAAASEAAYGEQIANWRKETESSEAINWKENGPLATAVYTKIATPEAREFLESSGLGNHPQIVGLFVKIGQMLKQAGRLGEDGTVSAGTSAPEKSIAERLYPSLKS